MQIGTCGLITFGDEYIKPDTSTLPVTDPFVILVAPFWDDIDLSAGRGEIRYDLVTNREDQSHFHVESYLRKATGTTFTLSWFLVAQWLSVCPSWDNACSNTMVQLIYNKWTCILRPLSYYKIINSLQY